ncbi:low molecular weight protein-tyrosine-phosphatase [Tropicibacter oceani]|uniref:protein-tyrosine-phosphatase n=1 Tax=Tropicibacter oceani TaxID=3058420 RepID=A0ABY8QGW1_9RHOB|nr:low molecular weight protein-tyrosine-phosphatase [Tropicibacter oceani]WGW03673.1 low molecular weight protein-tyrosine-phosphatase [Tropicibacter oceani]
MTKAILFVCLGNICRSPSAEGVVRQMAQAQGLDLRLDSAGTGDWHAGEPPYAPMQRAAAARGFDLSQQRARMVTPDDFDRFDLILAMDPDNLRHLQQMRPAQGGAQLRLFTDYAPHKGTDVVPDPYYTRDFDGTLDLIETCAKGLLAQL